MALILKDRVQETSVTTGTGTLTLAGAVTQFQTFSSAVGNGNTTYYTIYNAGGSLWEVGLGTVGAGTLSRDTVLASSNSNALVSFTGTLYVFGDYPAGKSVYLDAIGTATVSQLATSSTTSTTPVLSYNASNSNYAAGATVAGSYLQTVMQNKSGTAGASTNFAVSNDLGTDSTYYGEFGMNSSVYSAGTPADFFSLNNGIYYSGHDGDVTIGSGNGKKTYLAWGTTGQSAHVINATGSIGLNTDITGTNNYGTAGQVLTSQGNASTPTWTTPTTGTVTSVTGTAPVVSSGGTTPAISMAAANTTTNGYLTSTDWNTFNGKGSGSVTSVAATVPSFLSVTGSPITTSGTLALTYSGTALPVVNGGTGQTTYTDGQLLIGNTTGNTLTKSTLTAGSGISITNGSGSITIAASGGSALYTRTSFTATGGQTSFTVNYTVGYIEVFLNGVLLNASDYTATSGTAIVLSVAANAGDIVETIAFTTGAIASITNLAGGAANQVPYQSGVGTTAFNSNLTFNGTTLTAAELSGPHNGTVGATTPNTGAFTTLSATTAIALTSGGTGKSSAPAAMANLMGFTTTATAAGTTTLDNTSSYYQIFTGTSTQTIVLPVTSTLAQGWTFHICNNSTGVLTVNSSGGNLVLTIPPGTTVMYTCILTSGTTAASWEAGYTDFSTVLGNDGTVPMTAQFYLSSAGSALTGATQNFFGANSAVSLDAASTYDIECFCYFLKTTAGTIQWIPTFSSALTVGHSYLEYTPTTGFTTTVITGAMVVAEATQQTTTVLTHAVTGSLTGAVYHIAKLRIRITTNLACNFRLNNTIGAGSITPQAGSFYTARKVAINSGTFVA